MEHEQEPAVGERVDRRGRERLRDGLAAVAVTQRLRRAPRRAVVVGDAIPDRARHRSHRHQQPAVGQLHHARFLCDRHVGEDAIRNLQALAIRRQPRDLQVLRVRPVIEVLKTHECATALLVNPVLRRPFPDCLAGRRGVTEQIPPMPVARRGRPEPVALGNRRIGMIEPVPGHRDVGARRPRRAVVVAVEAAHASRLLLLTGFGMRLLLQINAIDAPRPRDDGHAPTRLRLRRPRCRARDALRLRPMETVTAAGQHDAVVAAALDAALRPHTEQLVTLGRLEDDEHLVVAVVMLALLRQKNGHVGLAPLPVGRRVGHGHKPFPAKDAAEQEKLPLRIPEHRLAVAEGEAGVEREIEPASGAGFAEADAVVIHEELRLVEPHRLVGARFEMSGHEIDRPAIKPGVRRAVVLVVAVVVVDEERVTAAAGGVAAHVVDRTGRERMQQRLAAVLAQQPARGRPRLAIVAADGPERTARSGPHDAKQPPVRQFHDGRFLAGADLRVAGKRHGDRVLVEREPTDLELCDFGVVVHVVEPHELDDRIVRDP